MGRQGISPKRTRQLTSPGERLRDAGALRLPAAAFLATGATGLVTRFTAVFLFPELFR
jgi:hypothetical protein